MTSRATRRFWKLYQELPGPVQRLAVKNYRFWRGNPHHPSLDFKKLSGPGERFSIRVGEHYRALGHKITGGYEWVWIGTHGGVQQTCALMTWGLPWFVALAELPEFQQVTLKALRWEERDERLVIEEGETVA